MVASANRPDLGEHKLVPQSDNVDYVTLASDDLFQEIERDNSLLADDTALLNLLRNRRNKKNDFKAVLLHINGLSSAPTVPKELRAVFREINSVNYCNSDELVLLTELAYRSKIMTGQHNNEINNKRCVEIAEQLGRSSSRAWIKGIVVTVFFPVIFAGIFLASAYPIMHLLSTYQVFQTFLLSFNNLLYASFGISSIVGLFSTGYAINRLRSSNELHTVSLTTHEFLFSRNNAGRDEKAPQLNAQLKSGELFQSLEQRADWLANNELLFHFLKRRDNKKLDLLAVLSYLIKARLPLAEQIRNIRKRHPNHLNATEYTLLTQDDLVRQTALWMRSMVYHGNPSSTELALLTELAYRMTKKDNQANNQRCLAIAEQLQRASSPWAGWICNGLLYIAYATAATSLTSFLFMSVPPILAAFYALTLLTWSITYLCNDFSKSTDTMLFPRVEQHALASISQNAQSFFKTPSAADIYARNVNRATASASSVPLVPVSNSNTALRG